MSSDESSWIVVALPWNRTCSESHKRLAPTSKTTELRRPARGPTASFSGGGASDSSVSVGSVSSNTCRARLAKDRARRHIHSARGEDVGARRVDGHLNAILVGADPGRLRIIIKRTVDVLEHEARRRLHGHDQDSGRLRDVRERALHSTADD